jgi:superfamily II DNA or RNA helicase
MSTYTVGSLVEFRGRKWVVMPSMEKDVLPLHPLTGSEYDTCGLYLPLEQNNLKPAELEWPTVNDIGDFESARLLRNAARLLLRHGAGPFRSMGHLSFYPRPYQLVPLLMALRLNPVRMLIADDVGIGKTIESALIARELLDRGEIGRIAVVCPPYLCDQWQRELLIKFNISAEVINTRTLAKLERKLPRQDISVFQYYPHIIVSIDFIKSAKYNNAFLLHCPEFVIVDEAHGCSRPAGQSVSQQQRHKLVFDLARKEDKHILLVTATPHSGIEESFLSLLGFIKPAFENLNLEVLSENQRVELAHHLIQRRRADVKQWMGADTAFPERDSPEEPYTLSKEYKLLFENIYKFARELVISDDTQNKVHQRVRYWAALALLRCVMSSPAAATAALSARIEKMTGAEVTEDIDYSSYILDPTDVENVEDVVPTHVVNESQLSFTETEKRKLREFIKDAESLKEEGDTKILKAEAVINELIKDGYSPIVYCRYISTAQYVAQYLQKRLSQKFKNIHVIAVTSENSDDEREIRVNELAKSAQRVLVATDCLSEGINLQEHFNAVVHYDLPWNPNRLEQREGRVDRFRQIKPVVKAILIYGADNPIDGAVLDVLLRKAKKIHKTLGITVPLPVDSESVMETVLKALFLRGKDSADQLSLFSSEELIVDVHRKWDSAVEKEKKSRTRFAQHAIKPDEVAQELKVSEAILGNSEVVETFIKIACQRLGSPLSQISKHQLIDVSRLPQAVQFKLSRNKISKIQFEHLAVEDVTYVSRNHPLSVTLAEYLLNSALQSEGNRNIAARCGVIRSRDVDAVTTLLLLRIRFLIKDKKFEKSSFAEECIVAGFRGSGASETWISKEEAEDIFEKAAPSENISDSDKKYWVNTALNSFESINKKLGELSRERANALLESYERVRKTIKSGQVSVEPLMPVDVLSLSIIVPKPRIVERIQT